MVEIELIVNGGLEGHDDDDAFTETSDLIESDEFGVGVLSQTIGRRK